MLHALQLFKPFFYGFFGAFGAHAELFLVVGELGLRLKLHATVTARKTHL